MASGSDQTALVTGEHPPKDRCSALLRLGMRTTEADQSVLRQNVKRPIVGCFHRPMMSGQLVRVSGGLERPIVQDARFTIDVVKSRYRK